MARQPERISILGGNSGPRFVAPANNALALAQSLGSIRPEAAALSQSIGTQLQASAEAKARQDALSTSGAAFADAVRDGQIEPTQNPWYVQAYNRESAAVSGRAALTELRVSSLEWDERDDPVAFQERWNQEVAGISSQYEGIDGQAGIQPVINEVSSQVINSNTAENVQRITTERDANMGTLIAQEIRSLYQASPNVNPQVMYERLNALREQYVGTGGSDSAFDELISAGVTTVAYSENDPDLLDVLRHDRGEGLGALFDRPGVADQVENDRFRIDGARRRAETRELEAAETQIRVRGREALTGVYTDFGTAVLTGDVPVDELVGSMEAQGFSAAEIAVALNEIQRGVSDHQSLNRAYLDENDQDLFSLYRDARINGYSSALEDQLGIAVASGRMPANDAMSILGTAMSTTDRAASGSDAASEQAGLRVTTAAQLRTSTDDLAELAGATIRNQFGGMVSSRTTERNKERVRAAAMRVLHSGGSYGEAMQAARDETAALIREAMPSVAGQTGVQMPSSPQAQQPTGGNPRRSGN